MCFRNVADTDNLFVSVLQLRHFCSLSFTSGGIPFGHLIGVIGFADLRFIFNPLASLTVGSGSCSKAFNISLFGSISTIRTKIVNCQFAELSNCLIFSPSHLLSIPLSLHLSLTLLKTDNSPQYLSGNCKCHVLESKTENDQREPVRNCIRN